MSLTTRKMFPQNIEQILVLAAKSHIDENTTTVVWFNINYN